MRKGLASFAGTNQEFKEYLEATKSLKKLRSYLDQRGNKNAR
jgi:uncharacterized Zn finger protein